MPVFIPKSELPQYSYENMLEYERYTNCIHQLKKEEKLGKHYGSNKTVGKLSRKK